MTPWWSKTASNLDGETELEQVKENNQALKRLALRKEEWLKTTSFS